MQIEITCKSCGKKVLKKKREKGRKPAVYCSVKCFAQTLKIHKTCKQCGSQYNKYQNKDYCSRKCAHISRIGTHMSEEARRKMSLIKQGTFPSHLFTEAALIKKHQNMVFPKPRYGADHHNWKGGQSTYKERVKRISAATRHKRRILCKRNGGSFSGEDVLNRIKIQQNKCFYCNADLSQDYQIDHFVPLIRGGRNDACNIVLACPKCNRRKSDKLPDVFIKEMATNEYKMEN